MLALMIAVLLSAFSSHAANPELLTKAWKARWIAVPGSPPFDYGVYHFRRSLDLKSQPATFVIHVTADNRYQLYVNGERVAWGPARGDLFHWRYETVDIARWLKPGKNVLAAVVWNEGRYAAVAQISNRTGFLLQGDTEAEQAVNTGAGWLSFQDAAYQALPLPPGQSTGYYAIGPGEQVDGAAYPWGWERPEYDDSAWKPAQAMSAGAPRHAQDGPNRWMLVPRPIPLMEETPERLARVRKTEGVTLPAAFPRQAAPWQVPPRSSARLLLDQNHLTTAFPELVVSGGRGARITLRYAEALWIPGTREKAHRDDIEGKQFLGNLDLFIADGGARRLFRPLFWRTYRYIEMNIQTAGEPLTVEDLRGVYTGYPFVRRARFDAGPGADAEELRRILDVGWRTARLCAHESYMDCPYYEQLQYAGDTRIQALVSLYMTGDARLMRNAIEHLDSSRTAEGATYSRAPSALQQYIPPFSLWWIGMVHDYWMHVEDQAFVRQMLPGVRAVLTFFGSYQQPGGLLGRMPWWNFVDWVGDKWRNGVPPMDDDGSSASIELQLLLAYRWAAEMEAALGSSALAREYQAAGTKLRAAVRENYWDAGRGLYADTPRRAQFSQHANTLALLAGLVAPAEAPKLMERVIGASDLAPESIYFRHYLHSALREAGLGDRYLEMLGPWRTMLSKGLTTWAEWEGARVRSDCHAWGASPNFELFRTVLGIESAAPGFRRVLVRPHLGRLARASGAIPHPRGEIAVSLELKNGKLLATVTLPAGVTGEFVWRSTRRPLASGRTAISLGGE